MPKSYLEFAAGSTHSMATEVMFQLEIYNWQVFKVCNLVLGPSCLSAAVQTILVSFA